LVLQETTIQLIKKSSEYYPKNKESEMSTERFSKEKMHKQSIDYGVHRIKTDMDEVKNKHEISTVEMNVDELREVVHKLRALKS
jgi:hypothetical protein